MLATSPDYPRVLVVGPEPFNFECGFGITISNLFSGWPKDRLACLHFSGISPDDTICEHHYGLNRHGVEWPLIPRFLTRIFRKPGSSDDIVASGICSATSGQRLEGSTRIVGIIKQALIRSGVGSLSRVQISEGLKAWVQRSRPNVIYCAVHDLTQIELVLSLAKLTQAAVVTHALDDWIMTPFQNENFFQRTLRRYTHQRLRRLYRRSSACLAIGEEMCRAYRKRYGIEFLPFFNCPDADYWTKLEKKDWRARKPFKFVFTGMVYWHGNHVSILRFAEAIELVCGDEACTLEIYSTKAAVDGLRPMLQGLENTTVHLPCKDVETVAKLCRDADSLVLTMDFAEDSPNNIQLSMPTRLTPFLLSGTPIFAFAPPNTAIGRFFLEHQTAYLVDKWMEAEGLAQLIKEFVVNEDLRRQIGLKARHVATTELAGEVVRPRFHEMIRSAVRCHIQPETPGTKE